MSKSIVAITVDDETKAWSFEQEGKQKFEVEPSFMGNFVVKLLKPEAAPTELPLQNTDIHEVATSPRASVTPFAETLTVVDEDDCSILSDKDVIFVDEIPEGFALDEKDLPPVILDTPSSVVPIKEDVNFALDEKDLPPIILEMPGCVVPINEGGGDPTEPLVGDTETVG